MQALYVVGAGGIGCAVGYTLCAAGHRVTFVDADPDKVRWGRAHGVAVDGRDPLPADFQHFDDWAPQADATVLLCTKCYDNRAVLARLPATAALLPVQNGFDRAIDTRGATLEGIASFVSECSPRRPQTRITRAGRLHFGQRSSDQPPNPAALRRRDELLGRLGFARSPVLKRLRIRVEVVPDILPYKYTKLMYNAAISPLAAAAGLDNGQLLGIRKARRLFFDLLRENYAILRGAGVGLGKIGPFHPDTVQRILNCPAVANSLAWAFYPSLRGSYCSMSGDLPKGRTEIEFYNRHLIDLAGERPCPVNRRVYGLIKRMESERMPPGLLLLDELRERRVPGSA